MDSKQPIRSTSYEDEPEPAPPTYSESISTSTYYSTQIRSQLSNISATITAIESQRSLLNSARDEKVLSLLTTQIQIFLSNFANSGLKRGTLILVPANGLTDEKSIPTDYDFKNEDDFDRVVRVRSKDDPVYDEFSSEPCDAWFWKDEDMALRLAKCLKPPPDPRKAELSPRKQSIPAISPIESSSSSGRTFWGKKKSASKPPLTLPEALEPIQDQKVQELEKGDYVSMTVEAEEIVFRTENDFGMYGTERGWGIVLRLGVIVRDKKR